MNATRREFFAKLARGAGLAALAAVGVLALRGRGPRCPSKGCDECAAARECVWVRPREDRR